MERIITCLHPGDRCELDGPEGRRIVIRFDEGGEHVLIAVKEQYPYQN